MAAPTRCLSENAVPLIGANGLARVSRRTRLRSPRPSFLRSPRPYVLSAFLRLPSCRGEERCRCQHGRRWWCVEAGAWSQAAAECSKDIVGSLKITKQQYSLRDQPELLFCTRWRTLVVRAFLFSTVSRCTGSAAIRISVRTRSKGD